MKTSHECDLALLRQWPRSEQRRKIRLFNALDDASSAFVGFVPAVHVCYACKSFGAQSMLFVVVLFVSAFGSCIFDMLRVCR